jgi:hypothetical protein
LEEPAIVERRARRSGKHGVVVPETRIVGGTEKGLAAMKELSEA